MRHHYLFIMTRRGKRWATISAVVVIASVIAYFALLKTVEHLLSDGALTRAIGKKTAVILQADTGYLPLFWRGLSVRSDGLLVRGKPPRALSELRATNLQARCSLQDLWQRKWTINRLQAERLEVAFGAAAAQQLAKILPAEPTLQPQVDISSPLKLVIRETVIQHTDLLWGDTPETIGALRDVKSKYYPDGPGLNVVAMGGNFQQTGWPMLRVMRIQMHYARPKLEIRSADLAIGKAQDVTAGGVFDFGENGGLHLHVRSAHAPAEPFLTGFWRGKFEGTFSGETQIDKNFAKDAKVRAAGQLNFERAEVHDVATLDRVAAVTNHPQFGRLKLSELRGRYKWAGAKLEVSELRIEQKNLFRVEGEFTIENKNVEGRFRIGATADVLSAIPGAREKVFTESRDGYFWTSMKLDGPLNHPREDLKARLMTAAEEQLAKRFLAPLFKPGKGILELLNALYEDQ